MKAPAAAWLRCAFVAGAAAAVMACGGTSATRGPSRATAQEVTLPGVDTRDFTARERREFTEYVGELPAPCKGVAVPIAQCILERRACDACVPAAKAIAQAVRDGMARDQVQDLYKTRFDARSMAVIPLDGSPTRGPLEAPVVVVEFADFECPFCQQLAPELDALWERRKDQVRFVYKFMPLQMHPHSEAAARAAIAAMDQGKFWQMHRQLFANGQHLEPNDLDAYAKALGLDMDRFHSDMASSATQARIDADKKLANDLKINGTPTLYIDGREYSANVDLGDWLDQEIAARTGHAASPR